MRDAQLMQETLRTIADNGGRACFGLVGCMRYGWACRGVNLNGQAVMDMLADGWLVHPAGPHGVDFHAAKLKEEIAG